MLKPIAVSLLCLGLLGAADIQLGKPLRLREATPIGTLTAHPERYAGKTVQVKGKVVEVCRKMGCWMNLADDAGNLVRIKVRDGEIVFPKEAVGRTAVAEGKFVKLSLTREQALARRKHEAEENGRAFDPATVTGPATIWQIQGEGAVVPE